jgi:hypothetical protein
VAENHRDIDRQAEYYAVKPGKDGPEHAGSRA